jgi:hypothetical protein
MGKVNNYPKNRKKKLSDPRDKEFYHMTYIKEYVSKNGNVSKRRTIKGVCEVCSKDLETTWGNFTRHSRNPYRFLHLKCAQYLHNEKQREKRKTRPAKEVHALIYKKYVVASKRRGIVFTLTVEEFSAIIQLDCVYCSDEPRSHDHWGHVKYNGIDRKNNDEGYTVLNSVPCCTRCNFIKKDTPYDVWQDFLKKVAYTWQS